MSTCQWCGREYDHYYGFMVYCSKRCYEEERASRESREREREYRAEQRRQQKEEAAIRQQEKEEREAEIRELKEILREEEERERREKKERKRKAKLAELNKLDIQAQCEGFKSHFDKNEKIFQKGYNECIEKIKEEYKQELEETSKEDADFRLASFFEKAVNSSNKQYKLSEAVFLEHSSDISYYLAKYSKGHFDAPVGIRNSDVEFLFAYYPSLVSFKNENDRYELDWKDGKCYYELSFNKVHEYLSRAADNGNARVMEVLLRIVAWYRSKTKAAKIRKITGAAVGLTVGLLLGLILGRFLFNLLMTSQDAKDYITGAFGLIGIIGGFCVGGIFGAIGGLIILGLIGLGLGKIFTVLLFAPYLPLLGYIPVSVGSAILTVLLAIGLCFAGMAILKDKKIG